MERTHLAMLALCALLSTNVDPFAGLADTTASAVGTAVGGEMSAHLDERADDSVAARPNADVELVGQILARLARPHTALPERERLMLARTIVREARAHDLEPDLVVAVIEVESAGYHLAVSHVGAMGLMQLLPATGRELADKLEIDWLGPDTLFDPSTNVRLGTAYLRELADRYDGDVSIALAAYNWGPGRIDRRLKRGATVPSRYIEQVMRVYDRNAEIASRRS